MSDIHALSGAYAIDALDDIERAQFERHLAECAECRAEVESLREAGGLLAEAVATAPPPSLRDKVLADIATVRPLPPVTEPATRQRRRFRPAALVAAAAAVIALGVGAAVVQPWDDGSSQTQLSAVDQVLQAAGRRGVHPDTDRRRRGHRGPVPRPQQGRDRHHGHAAAA